jgi:hypothetical protein
MTHKYERISKVIKETFGEDFDDVKHWNLVCFAYAILEELEKDESQN